MITDTTDPDEQVNLSLSIQKLLISGYAAIESVIFAILALDTSFFDFLFQCEQSCQYSLITAVICISSCVELPSLKVFLTKYKDFILEICAIGETAFPDDGGRKSFINLRKSIEFSSLSPQSLFFGHWFGHSDTPVLPLIAIMSEKDELFAPLVMVATDELKNLNDICFSADICRRLMLTGPSPPAQLAIEAIAAIYDPTVILMNLVLKIIPFTLFVPAMELIYRSGKLLNLSQQSIIEAYFYITRKCTTGESPRSLYHLEYLGKHIDKIPKVSFFNLFNELMILNQDPRASARFILMITSNPSFFNIIKENTDCMMNLYQKMRHLMQDMTKIDLLATTSISFRNLFKNLADMKLFNNPQVNQFFLIGVNGLSTFANKGILQNLVTAIFCDLSGNPILSPKLASQIRTRLKNKSQFIEYLLKYDTALAKKEFSDYTQQTSVNVPKFSAKLWGAQGWVLYCSSKLYFKN
ncbi:hypothetical protein TVAGG3_0033130 [Trichomonas vaginalis G3]|uniref:hypothetical protein n=1 Tax=Trichomonas vaginalis (strain ATCC PRA-98 / G3) TaxID=412133 RepID=UPI0021E5AB64|nr:hypothetical protein TVAGG3_0033130 [Trichomonas vaginalis G3]KAI5540219.1 hypothetical protein TVAGG3_0033130 [Trichomonas vaginalis G3]